jgi:hypothetical protein
MHIFNQLNIAVDSSVFGISVGLSLLLTIGLYSFAIIRNPRILLSICYTVGIILILMYQVPIFLFSKILVTDLDGRWLYFFIINFLILIFLIFGFFLTDNDDCTDTGYFLNSTAFYMIIIIASMSTLFIYVNAISFKCTAMYALIFSPELLLLSREFGLKIIGGSLATYAVGAYLNFFGPLLFSLSILKTFNSIEKNFIIKSILYLHVGVFALWMGLIVGVKGALLNFALYSIFMTLAMKWRSFKADAFRVLVICILFFTALISLEIYKEVDSAVGGSKEYDFPTCVSNNKRCSESITLLNSLHYREHSLGLSFGTLERLQSEVNQKCTSDFNKPFEFEGSIKRNREAKKEANKEINNIDNTNAIFERVAVYFKAIFNRIFIVPFQVSLWHFIKAQENSIDAKLILPLSGTLFGEKINIAEVVYQEYAIKYNGGDKTSTGTAPTTYLLLYPFYAGLLGFVIATLLTIVVDIGLFILRRNYKRLPFKFYFSICFVLALNLSVSEFITVMFSHGGFASLFFLLVSSIVGAKNSKYLIGKFTSESKQ